MLDWMVDCGYTPHLIVDASSDVVQVPRQFVKEGKIVLNISTSATQRLALGNEWIEFDARFAGVVHHVKVPIAAVLGIYARESGEGMVFPGEDGSPEPPEKPPAPEEPTRRPKLKVVK